MLLEEKIPKSYPKKEFIAKVKQISNALGINPDWLMLIMYHESGLRHWAYNPNGGATGLIQFMPATAAGLGTSTSALKAMGAVKQLDYVYKYFKGSKNHLNSFFDLYLYTFFPIAVGKKENFVLQAKGISAGAIAAVNGCFDLNKDKQITIKEFKTYLKDTYLKDPKDRFKIDLSKVEIYRIMHPRTRKILTGIGVGCAVAAVSYAGYELFINKKQLSGTKETTMNTQTKIIAAVGIVGAIGLAVYAAKKLKEKRDRSQINNGGETEKKGVLNIFKKDDKKEENDYSPTYSNDSFPLKKGSKGDNVTKLQEYLVSKGENIGIDGDFGNKTLTALQKVTGKTEISESEFNALISGKSNTNKGESITSNLGKEIWCKKAQYGKTLIYYVDNRGKSTGKTWRLSTGEYIGTIYYETENAFFVKTEHGNKGWVYKTDSTFTKPGNTHVLGFKSIA